MSEVFGIAAILVALFGGIALGVAVFVFMLCADPKDADGGDRSFAALCVVSWLLVVAILSAASIAWEACL